MVDVFGGSGGTGILRGQRGPPGRFMYDIKALQMITQSTGVFGDYFALDIEGAFEVTIDSVKRIVYWIKKKPGDVDALLSIVGPQGPKGSKEGARFCWTSR